MSFIYKINLILLLFHTLQIFRAFRVRPDVKQFTSEILSSHIYKLPTFEGTELQDPSDNILVNGLTFRRSIQPFKQYGISESIYSFPTHINPVERPTVSIAIPAKSLKALPAENNGSSETYVNYEQVKGVIKNHIRSGLVISWPLDKWWLHLKMLFGLNETDVDTKATILGFIETLSDCRSPKVPKISSPIKLIQGDCLMNTSGDGSIPTLIEDSEQLQESGLNSIAAFDVPLSDEYINSNSPENDSAPNSISAGTNYTYQDHFLIDSLENPTSRKRIFAEIDCTVKND